MDDGSKHGYETLHDLVVIALAIKYHSDITEWVLMKTILGTEGMVIELNIKTIHVI